MSETLFLYFVLAQLLFNIAKGPTLCWNAFPLDPTPPGVRCDVSAGCFCIIASDILLAFKKSRIENISPEFLRPSESLSYSTSTVTLAPFPLHCKRPGVMALRRPILGFRILRHSQFKCFSNQFEKCFHYGNVSVFVR